MRTPWFSAAVLAARRKEKLQEQLRGQTPGVGR